MRQEKHNLCKDDKNNGKIMRHLEIRNDEWPKACYKGNTYLKRNETSVVATRAMFSKKI